MKLFKPGDAGWHIKQRCQVSIQESHEKDRLICYEWGTKKFIAYIKAEDGSYITGDTSEVLPLDVAEYFNYCKRNT